MLMLLSMGAFAAPQVFEIKGAQGIPELGCREALGLVPTPKPGPDRPSKPIDRNPKPDIETWRTITVGGEAFDPKAMPGGDPDALPPQPLEGPPEVIQKVGAVMQKAAQGQRVRMSFFGASHTGGDFWTGQIRRQLQRRHGDIGHGFVFPAAPYKGYRGNDINLCRSANWFADYVGKRDGRDDGLYGFAGASLSSDDPGQFGWLETTHSNPEGRRFSRVDVFALGQPRGGQVEVQIDGAPPVTIPTQAPSSEMLWWRFQTEDGGHRINMKPTGDGEVRLLGASVERDGPGVIVDAMGIRGRMAKTWLDWDQTLLQAGMKALSPDLVVLAYGTNEAADPRYEVDAYRADLEAVLTRLRSATDAACVLVGPSDRGVKKSDDTYLIWDRTRAFAQVQREVAPQFGCAFWDWQQATGGEGSMIAWRFHDPPLAAKDLIHFTAQGYKRSGDLFLDALDAATLRK